MARSTLRNILAILIAGPVLCAFAQDPVPPAASGASATTIYRQVMPDGRIVYSDKVQKGARIDQTISVERPIKGNLWTTEAGARPAIPPQTEPTHVNKVNAIPAPGKKKTLEEANSEVIHAEMLLEDARKRQEAGVEPLPGERTGNAGGGSRLNERYQARQELLAREVADAQAALKQAIAERDALRNPR